MRDLLTEQRDSRLGSFNPIHPAVLCDYLVDEAAGNIGFVELAREDTPMTRSESIGRL